MQLLWNSSFTRTSPVTRLPKNSISASSSNSTNTSICTHCFHGLYCAYYYHGIKYEVYFLDMPSNRVINYYYYSVQLNNYSVIQAYQLNNNNGSCGMYLLMQYFWSNTYQVSHYISLVSVHRIQDSLVTSHSNARQAQKYFAFKIKWEWLQLVQCAHKLLPCTT